MVTTYHGKRRATQIATLALFLLIPASGMLRIDLVAGNFVIFGRQTCWSDFSLMFGAMVIFATAPLLTYPTVGRVWCGWACPQNTLSEWANYLTRKLLGKRATVEVRSDTMQLAPAKNTPLNWVILTGLFFAASVVLGIVPFFFFFSPDLIWAMLTFTLDSKLARFMHPLYLVSVIAAFLDIAVIRYFWCNYACMYKVGQYLFRTQDALHVAYDATRADECDKCNYCATSCVIEIEPTREEMTATCINCGECIDACHRLQAKEGRTGLLRFSVGKESRALGVGQFAWKLLAKFNFVGVAFLLGCAIFSWGLFHISPTCWQ